MLNIESLPPETQQVYRGATVTVDSDFDHATTWFTSLTAGVADALDSTPDGQVPQLACGAARNRNLRNVSPDGSIATIDVDDVQITELVPLPVSRETILRLAEAIDERDRELAELHGSGDAS